MFRIARMFLSLGNAQVGEFRAQTGRRVLYYGLLAFFGLIFVGFGLAAITAKIADELGMINALAIMAGAAFLCCLIVLILIKLAERRHRALAAERAELQRRLSQLAMMAAFGSSRPKTSHLIGLGVLAAGAVMLLGRLGGGNEDEDT